MKIENGYASVNGINLYYETAGKGRPVLLIHGMGLDCRMWNDQFSELAKHYHVIRYDLRGFGKSSLPSSESYSHHLDLFFLLNHLDISNVSLIGLSMGGRIATDFALTCPQMVSELILVDAVIHGYSFKTFSLAEVVATAKEAGAAAAKRVYLKNDLFRTTIEKPAVAAMLSQIVSSYSGWHWLNENPWTPLSPPSIQQLDKIKARTLILVGEEDLPDFQSMADILKENIPHSQKLIIPNAGHMCNMENPGAFNNIVLSFLSSSNQTNSKKEG